MLGNFDLLKTPSDHNIAWSWVTTILPADTSSPWGHAMAIFSSALVYLGALFIAFHIIVSIASAAQKGEVLRHSILTPIRIILGIGLMIPIASGFSSGHHLLRDVIARPAINLVDGVWVSYVDYAAGKEVRIAPVSAGGRKLVFDILESEICVAVVNEMAAHFPVKQSPLPPAGGERKSDPAWLGLSEKNGRQVWSYGENCGSISIPEVGDKPKFTEIRVKAASKIVAGTREIAQPFGPLFAKHMNTFSIDSVRQLVSDGEIPSDLAERVQTFGRQYDEAITAATNVAMQANENSAERRQKLVEAARQQGFISAGMWWGHISKRSQQVGALTGQHHERVGPRIGERGSASDETLSAALNTLRYAITGHEAEIGISASDFAATGDEDASLLTRGHALIARPLNEWVLQSVTGGTDDGRSTVERIRESDPIGNQISSGHFFMTTAMVVITVLGGIIALAFTLPADAAGLDGAAIWAMAWLAGPLGTLWIVGAVRAYVLPMLPFVYMWVFGALWLLAIVEAAIALIVWAFSFLRLDGEEFLAQQSKMGAMLLFNVFLMPVLGMLAFCACFALLPLIVGGLEIFWATAFYAQQGGQITALGALLVGFIMITFLTMYLVMHIFGQIFNIPDRIIVWFGGNSHGFADKSLFVAMAGGMAATFGRGMPGIPAIPRPNRKSDGDAGGIKSPGEGGLKARDAGGLKARD